MITPWLESSYICFRDIVENGISLTHKINFFLSFSATAAALVIKVSQIPEWIFAKVFIEQGAIMVLSILNEPDAGPSYILSSSKNLTSL